MTHDRLWAPWRLAYVAPSANPVEPPPEPGCFLCRYQANPTADAEQFVVTRGTTAFVVLNRFPYNNGHLLVAPQRHVADLTELTPDELLETQQQCSQMVAALRRVIQPQGFNIGLNLGQVAGAGLPGHLHWHIVPRWAGDSNFMTTCSDVRVIPQSLAALYELLRADLAD